MMTKKLFTYTLLVFAGCNNAERNLSPAIKGEQFVTNKYNSYKTIGDIQVATGYIRVKSAPGTFASWLRTIPLKEEKTVYLYDGSAKRNQTAQFAVLDISTGNKDLQQCADAVMRLRAEYLFDKKLYDSIAFMDYSGKWYRWQGGDRQAFDQYLQRVFGWCGSASLEKQMKKVNDFNDISAGDVLIKGGFPGHAMIVMDVAVNKEGKKIFLLAQGYQPAQDMHVVINPMDSALSPWYQTTGHVSDPVASPEWTFDRNQLKRW